MKDRHRGFNGFFGKRCTWWYAYGAIMHRQHMVAIDLCGLLHKSMRADITAADKMVHAPVPDSFLMIEFKSPPVIPKKPRPSWTLQVSKSLCYCRQHLEVIAWLSSVLCTSGRVAKAHAWQISESL